MLVVFAEKVWENTSDGIRAVKSTLLRPTTVAAGASRITHVGPDESGQC